MKYADDYEELYNSNDDWYLIYVDEQLKQIKRRYEHDNHCRTKTKE